MGRLRINLRCFFVITSFLLILITSAVKTQISRTLNQNENLRGQASSHNKIESAFLKKEITLDEKVLNHAYAMFDSKKLPAVFQSSEEEYCGTWVLEEIRRNWQNLRDDTKSKLINDYRFNPGGILSRPPGLDQSRSTEHFKIHYSVTFGDTNAVSTRDYNGNGTPDYVDALMSFVEEIWNYEILTMGYYPPPTDGNEGGDDKYDIYLAKIGSWGTTYPETLIGNNPNSPFDEVNAATSYILIRNQFQDYEWSEASLLKTVAAHEFYHSIQNGYDSWEAIWICEATATWGEDEVYDNENVLLRWLPDWFAQPWVPLDANASESSQHWYGSWIFFRYLSESVNRDLVRTIWEKAIQYDDTLNTDYSFKAIDNALSTAGLTFQDVFKKFTTANFFPSEFYEEGGTYPKPAETAIAINNFSYTGYLNRRAAHYFVVSPNIIPKGNDEIYFSFQQHTFTPYLQAQIITRAGTTITERQIEGVRYLAPTKDLDEIAVAVINIDSTKNSRTFTLTIKTNSQLHRIAYNVEEDWHNTLSLSGKTISWKDNDNYGRWYYGTSIRKRGEQGYGKPAIDSNTVAYSGRYQWTAPIRNTKVVKYNDCTTTHTIGSPDWNLVSAWQGSPSLLLHKGKTVFAASFLYPPSYFVAVSTSGGAAQIISDTLAYKPRIWHLDNGLVIWTSAVPPTGGTQKVYWYNGAANVLPPTKHNDPSGLKTIPRLSDGKLAWIESSSDNIYSMESYELYYFDGSTVNRITNDSIPDAASGTPEDIFYSFDFKHGKIAWLRQVYSPVWGQKFFVAHLYENGNIKVLWDSVAQGPQAFSSIKIDEKKCYVAWLGNFPTDSRNNIFLYDGTSIFPVIPPSANLVPEYFEIDDGRIGFTAYKETPALVDYAIYLYEYDSTLTSVEVSDGISESFTLWNCYPNPFNSSTTVRFAIPHKSEVAVKIYNILGEEVQTLVNEVLDKGTYNKIWNAENAVSGVYIVNLVSNKYRQAKKIILLK